MKTRAIVTAALAAALSPAIAHAEEFETKAQGAVKVSRHDELVWALTAACDKGDDVQQRQCRIVRDRKAKTLAGVTLWVTGEAGAVRAGAWSAQKKSLPVRIAACVNCGGVEVDGRAWSIVGGAARIEGGKVRGGTLYDNARPFADEAAATAWAKTVAAGRFELLVKTTDKRRIQIGGPGPTGKTALAVDVIAWRVVNTCDGAIVLSSVPSGPGELDKTTCAGRAGAGESTGPAVNVPADGPVEALTAAMVRDAMRSVVTAARQCSNRMKVTGRAKLEITINADGSIAKHAQTGDFVGTPMGRCIDDAMRAAVFPKSKKPTTKIGFPIVLQ